MEPGSLLRRPLVRRAIALALGAGFALGVCELAAMGLISARAGRWVGTGELAAAQRADNTFTHDLTSGECRYVDTLFPHPYLGFVHHRNEPCGLQNLSHVGVPGPPQPRSRDPEHFTVLVLGGSVASQLVSGGVKRTYLEQELEARWRSPTGKPFRIVAGADGAWKQPQQAIFYLLYADVVDAVVTLDGFNEHYRLGAAVDFEAPASNFELVNPLATAGFGSIASRYLAARAIAGLAELPVLHRSHLAWLVVGVVSKRLRREPDRPSGPTTTVGSLFPLPPGLDAEARYVRAMGKYARYVRSIDVLARANGHPAAHFVQPAPALERALAPEEQGVVGDLGYAPIYARMTADLLRLRWEGAAVFSLLDAFRDEPGPIYEDAMHFRVDAGGECPGNRILSQRIASALGEAWALSPRKPGASP